MKTRHGITSALLAGLVGLGCGEEPGLDEISTNDPTIETQSQLSSCAWGGGGWIRVADFNGDGKMDIASPNNGFIETYLATGSPAFTFTYQHRPVSPNPFGIAEYTWVGDFDSAGGFDDIASANGGSLYVKLAGTNFFTPQTWSVTNTWGASGYTFAADFTGDGKTEIATGASNFINLYVKGVGSQMQTIPSNKSFTWGGAADPLRHSGYTWAGDFTGDGKADIGSAVGNKVYMKVFNFLTNTFDEQAWTVINEWGGGTYTFAADFTGDHRTDIASFNGGNGYMKISTGSGFDLNNHLWPVDNTWGPQDYTWVADVTGDGRADVISRLGGTVYLKIANSFGNGFLSKFVVVSNSWGSADSTRVGDFTGDGKADIVTFNGCSGTLLESGWNPATQTFTLTPHAL